MEIKINGKPLDFTIDNEKTIGDVLAALEQWLTNSGHRMSELSVDGEKASVSMIEDVFAKEIMNVKCLDLCTDTVANLAVSSLETLLDDLKSYESLDFSNKANFRETWKESAQAKFISEQWSDLFSLCGNVFSGSVSSEVLFSITEERLREVQKPVQEYSSVRQLLNETCSRLVDLPLDIQTGKDKRAAKTIQIFSGISEKIIRIYRQLDLQGLLTQTDKTSNESAEFPAKLPAEKSIQQLINDFGAAVKELLQAYERQDIILVGDLAEYEMAPRLQNLYDVIMKNIHECESDHSEDPSLNAAGGE